VETKVIPHPTALITRRRIPGPILMFHTRIHTVHMFVFSLTLQLCHHMVGSHVLKELKLKLKLLVK
jgi:hypothetical protein